MFYKPRHAVPRTAPWRSLRMRAFIVSAASALGAGQRHLARVRIRAQQREI